LQNEITGLVFWNRVGRQGSSSVGLLYEVVSLDLKGADINCDILEWDYKVYQPGYFDVVWCSPPCETFSIARRSLIGRYGYTAESIEKDMLDRGVPILRKAQEVISYLKPKVFFIENPRTGRMKDFLKDLPFYDVDYCRYGFDYRKATRIWTDLENFEPRVCNKKCGAFVNGRHLMRASGGTKSVKGQGGGNSRNSRYKIPERLVWELLIHTPPQKTLLATLEKSFVRSKEEEGDMRSEEAFFL
jgi:site-specific DNA-cytosine methylase